MEEYPHLNPFSEISNIVSMTKYFSLLVLIASLFSLSSSEDPQDLLHQARSKLFKNKSIQYEQKAFYPNPVGRIDTVEVSASFYKNEKSLVGYDFIIEKHFFERDVVHLDGVLRSVSHRDKSVVLYPDNEPEQVTYLIEILPDIEYSPITLLSHADWDIVSDTLVKGKKLRQYFRVENDEVRDGNTIYTEQHIFINPDSKLVEQWERRNYFNGNLQKVVYSYSDYDLDRSGTPLSYEFLPDYRSVLYGRTRDKTLLVAGQEAPFFSGNNHHNELFDLEVYRGQKILLNFSSIGCPHSQDALRYMNQEDFRLSDDISAFFISIWDKQEDVTEYFNQNDMPFLVIPNGDEISEDYGVSVTPTFYLINEEGKIEKVAVGYDKEFLESLKSEI